MGIPTKILLAKAQWNQRVRVWCRHLLGDKVQESWCCFLTRVVFLTRIAQGGGCLLT